MIKKIVSELWFVWLVVFIIISLFIILKMIVTIIGWFETEVFHMINPMVLGQTVPKIDGSIALGLLFFLLLLLSVGIIKLINIRHNNKRYSETELQRINRQMKEHLTRHKIN